ncbi:MAG: metallophosphoesterase family protein [Candidatus Kerfeldbacteria bacterium]|nr:metallophosphoesterase family protein [Candidatus Kerfeldbacteria bacterium]
MVVAVMSDLHDNVVAWGLIAKWLVDHQVAVLINCGDTSSPAMLERMAKDYYGTIHTVFGNVADRALESEVVEHLPNVTHHGDRGEVALAGLRLGFTHKPDGAEIMARSGEYDVVCHGHTHLKRWERIGDCRVLNPGTAGGMFQYPSIATLDLPKRQHEFIDLKL